MIAHEAFRRLAATAFDGPLEADDAIELQRHRAGCDACEKFEGRLRADADALTRYRPLAVPQALDRRIDHLLVVTTGRGRWSPALILLVAALMLVAAAASVAVGSYILQIRQNQPLPARPAVPADWTVTMSSTRDVRLALPPYVEVFSQDTVVVANEAPAANQSSWFEVTAAGPLSTENPGHLALEDWLLAAIGPADIRDFATFTTLALPAGVAVRMHLLIPNGDAIDEAAYYAIDTGEGLALLTLKGRAEDFVTHAADIELITRLWEPVPR